MPPGPWGDAAQPLESPGDGARSHVPAAVQTKGTTQSLTDEHAWRQAPPEQRYGSHAVVFPRESLAV
jgi:hypothetical protein